MTAPRRSRALVTGASRGFGLSVVNALSRSSWEVLALTRGTIPQFERPELVVSVVGDVTAPTVSERLHATLEDKPLDVLINNAGIGAAGTTLATASVDELSALFDVHVLGPLRVTKSVLQNLSRADHPLILNVSSRLSSMRLEAAGDFRQIQTSYAYRVAKAAQNKLTIAMAQELELKGLRVWAVHPGRLRTALARDDATMDPVEAAERLVALVQDTGGPPLRFVSLEDGRDLPW